MKLVKPRSDKECENMAKVEAVKTKYPYLPKELEAKIRSMEAQTSLMNVMNQTNIIKKQQPIVNKPQMYDNWVVCDRGYTITLLCLHCMSIYEPKAFDQMIRSKLCLGCQVGLSEELRLVLCTYLTRHKVIEDIRFQAQMEELYKVMAQCTVEASLKSQVQSQVQSQMEFQIDEHMKEEMKLASLAALYGGRPGYK